MLTPAYRPLSTLTKLEGNPRTIRDKAFKTLCRSLTDNPDYFEARPLILSDRTGQLVIIAGNQRYEAAKAIGLTEVPTILLPDLTEQREREIVIRDNVSNGDWNTEELANSWDQQELVDWGVEVAEWNMEPEEVPAAEEDNYSGEPPAEPVTVLGDLYELNGHRVSCGDSTDVGVVDRTLNGAKPYLMITDPPYGVVYDADWRNEAERADGTKIGGFATGKVSNDDNADWTAAWAISPAKVAYVYHAGLFSGVVAQSLQDCDFELRAQIIWAKNNFAISRGHYHWKHEPCWYAVKKGSTAQFIGDHTNTTLWEINKPQKSETGHSTQKPLECMSKPMTNHDGDVYDPFLGSGTTLMAGEQLGRTVYGQELSPNYMDVIVKRWVAYMATNGKPYTVKRNGIDITSEAWLTA